MVTPSSGWKVKATGSACVSWCRAYSKPRLCAEVEGFHNGICCWLPATVAGFSNTAGLPAWANAVVAALGPGQPLYLFLYAVLIAFFAFFYTAIVFNPKDTAEQLKKHSGFIPGYRPGERTADYIDHVLTRITIVGAIYLVVVCLLPEFLISATSVPFYLGGTSLLIVVSVTLDTVAQVQGHLIAHQYEGLIRKSKLRGGKKGG